MSEEQQGAFIVALVKALSENGWVGKTHIQKSVYFAQEAAGVALGFKYVIHYYGPYSRELDVLIRSLDSREVLSITAEEDGYGYKVELGDTENVEAVSQTLQNCAESVAKYLGGLNTLELERLSTAYYVRNRLPEGDKDLWTAEVRNLKPKFSESDVSQALDESASIAEAIRREQAG